MVSGLRSPDAESRMSASVVSLVERACAGDRAAYDELVTRFQAMVYAVALARLRNASDAQELAQDVFVQALAKLPQLRNPICFPAWLRQITVRLAINRRTRNRFHAGIEMDETVRDPSASPLEKLIGAEQRALVREALDGLGPIDRNTLQAFYILGLSIQEMSLRFAAPVGTIKRRLHVARKRLRRRLEDQAALAVI